MVGGEEKAAAGMEAATEGATPLNEGVPVATICRVKSPEVVLSLALTCAAWNMHSQPVQRHALVFLSTTMPSSSTHFLRVTHSAAKRRVQHC